MPRTIKRYWMALAAALLALASFPAAAAGPSLFTIPDGDLALNTLLKPVFGDPFSDGAASPLSSFFGVVNMGLMAIAGLIVFYVMVATVFNTAQDGEAFGKGKSGMWITLRTILGLGMVSPLPSGYCLAQYLLAWAIVQGIGLADTAWDAFVDAKFGDGEQAMMLSSVQTPAINSLAVGMLKSEVCQLGHAKLNSESMGIMGGTPNTTGDFATKRYYGVSGMSNSQCGLVEGHGGFVETTMSSVSNSLKSLANNTLLALSPWQFDVSKNKIAYDQQILNAHVSASQNLEAALAPIAQNIVNSTSGDADRAAFFAAIQAYQKEVADAYKSAVNAPDYFSDLRTNSKQGGFALAGTWFLQWQKISDRALKAFITIPQASPFETSGFNPDMRRIYANLNATIRSEVSGLDNQLLADQQKETDDGSASKSFLDTVFNSINNGLADMLKNNDISRSTLVVAHDAGVGILTAGGAGLAATFIVDKGSNALGVFAMGISASLLVCGGALLFVLPMVPIILWITALVGWFCAVAMAFCGIPLFALSMTVPGNSMFDSSRSGLLLLLGVVLKPIGMLAGFCLALVALDSIGFLCNQIFWSAVGSAASGMLGTVCYLVSFFVYLTLQLTLFKSLFGLISTVPSEIMKWIGGSTTSSIAQGMKEGHSVLGASGALVSGGIGGFAGAAMGSSTPGAPNPNNGGGAPSTKPTGGPGGGGMLPGMPSNGSQMQEKRSPQSKSSSKSTMRMADASAHALAAGFDAVSASVLGSPVNTRRGRLGDWADGDSSDKSNASQSQEGEAPANAADKGSNVQAERAATPQGGANTTPPAAPAVSNVIPFPSQPTAAQGAPSAPEHGGQTVANDNSPTPANNVVPLRAGPAQDAGDAAQARRGGMSSAGSSMGKAA